jgi:hypothetical protein
MQDQPTNHAYIRPSMCPDCLQPMHFRMSVPDENYSMLLHVMFVCDCGCVCATLSPRVCWPFADAGSLTLAGPNLRHLSFFRAAAGDCATLRLSLGWFKARYASPFESQSSALQSSRLIIFQRQSLCHLKPGSPAV